MIWIDKNQDGVADGDADATITGGYADDEIYNFAELIASLSLEDEETSATVDLDARDTNGDGEIDSGFIRFADGSRIYGAYEVTLVNGLKTTAYDMAFAHDELGYKIDVNGDLILEGSVTRKVRNMVASEATFLINGVYYGANGTGTANTITVDLTGSYGTRDVAIDGKGGNDSLVGGDGHDWIVGGAGDDTISGGRGDDVLFVDGDDVIQGGLGNDVAIAAEGSGGISITLGTASVEAFTGSNAGDAVLTGDTLVGVFISGLGGNDSLYGSTGDDQILGGDGTDTVVGNGGNDYLVGGFGNDSIDGGSGDDVVVADVSDTITTRVRGGLGWDLLILDRETSVGTILHLNDLGFEGAVGTNGNDDLRLDTYNGPDAVVTTQNQNGTLDGRAGNDVLFGGDGDDIIVGGSGNDSLRGRDGSDLYLGHVGVATTT